MFLRVVSHVAKFACGQCKCLALFQFCASIFDGFHTDCYVASGAFWAPCAHQTRDWRFYLLPAERRYLSPMMLGRTCGISTKMCV